MSDDRAAGERALHMELRDQDIQSGLDKLESVGLIRRENGTYYLGVPLDRSTPTIKEITARYGVLEGTEAVVLATVPPALAMHSLTFRQIKMGIVLARALHQEKYHGR